MPAIHENLKQIRRARGLTQETVAGKMGVTRQAISSYESGRTQPDLETLKRLAEVYDVELFDILYGKNRTQTKRRVIKIVAVASLIDVFVCNLAQSVLLWTANTYLRIESGTVTESMRPILSARMEISRVHNVIEVFSMVSFRLCCIVLLILLTMLERPVSPGAKLSYMAALLLGSAVTVLPWALCDNVYGLADYSYAAVSNLLFAAFAFGLSFAGEYIRKKFRSS